MAKVTDKDPIELLLDIERRSRSSAQELPQQEVASATWDGIAVLLGDTPVVVPMSEVNELLTEVRLTRVPGSQPWVLGLSNVRGNLLPVMDLKRFLGGVATSPDRRSRVLVVHHHGLNVGLLVDEVHGMRHFFTEQYEDKFPEDDGSLARHCRGSYRQGDERWRVFSLYSVVASPEFMQVAA